MQDYLLPSGKKIEQQRIENLRPFNLGHMTAAFQDVKARSW